VAAYYNEFDPFAAAWLRELIKAGHIAPGIVDERSIEDVVPADLEGFNQCHFFAGIGGWSYALRLAGWADDQAVWTGSCPCQPFSSAGKGGGFDDERHLWPIFQQLIAQCRPPVIFGEQVASKATDAWIDLVQSDLEAVGYAFGSVPFPSAGIGAPHIRDRNFWVSESSSYRCTKGWETGTVEARQRGVSGADECREFSAGFEGSGIELSGGVADSNSDGREARVGIRLHGRERDPEYGDTARSVAHPDEQQRHRSWYIWETRRGEPANLRAVVGEQPYASPTNGFWRDADWLFCRDEKWRPVEPGSFPLAHGVSARVGRLRGYGNAINAEAAKTFIEAYLG